MWPYSTVYYANDYYVVFLVIRRSWGYLRKKKFKKLLASAHTPSANTRLLHGMHTYVNFVYGTGYVAFSYQVVV